MLSVNMSTSDSDDEYFSVETILGKRIRNGTIFYLVKWQGFDESKNSWEPIANLLEFALSSILEYEEEQSVKSCSAHDIEIVGLEPSSCGDINVLLKTKLADRIFKFNSKLVALKWPESYIDFLQKHIKFWKAMD